MADQSFAAEPSPADGFYGRCADETFVRIEDTLANYSSWPGAASCRQSSASRWRDCAIRRR